MVLMREEEAEAVVAGASFHFIDAAKLRAGSSGERLPCMQDLQSDGWLVKRRIEYGAAMNGAYVRSVLVVSHRWETELEADPTGRQLDAIRTLCQADAE